MDARKIKDTRQRLMAEQAHLLKALERSQHAAEEIRIEKTEDEGDLAAISHDRDVLSSLHEGNFARLQLIQKAITTIDHGRYGECVVCDGTINEKRLDAIPWAAMCIECQEKTESEQQSSSMSLVGHEAEVEL